MWSSTKRASFLYESPKSFLELWYERAVEFLQHRVVIAIQSFSSTPDVPRATLDNPGIVIGVPRRFQHVSDSRFTQADGRAPYAFIDACRTWSMGIFFCRNRSSIIALSSCFPSTARQIVTVTKSLVHWMHNKPELMGPRSMIFRLTH